MPPRKVSKDTATESISKELNQVVNEGAFMVLSVNAICSGSDDPSDKKSAKDEDYRSKYHADYVDIYLDGKLMCEGESKLMHVEQYDDDFTTIYTKHGAESVGNYSHKYYGYTANLRFHMKTVAHSEKSFLKSGTATLEIPFKTVRVIFYCNGKTIADKTQELPERITIKDVECRDAISRGIPLLREFELNFMESMKVKSITKSLER